MSTTLDVSRPTPLRLLGFLFTAAGGLLIALGSLLTWATVGIVSDTEGVLDTAIPGIDRAEGVATLAMGVAILIGLVALRVVASQAARRAVALLITVCAAGALLVGLLDLSDTRSRFDDAGAERIIETVSQERSVPIEEARRGFEEIDSSVIEITRGSGLWTLVAGGALGLIGGLLDLVWVRRQRSVGSTPASAT